MELDWNHNIHEIGAGGTETTRTATPDECKAVAMAMDFLGCESIKAAYRIVPLGKSRFRAKGTLEAHLIQACVVSLDPVDEVISTDFEVEFRPAEQFDDETEVDIEDHDVEDPEPITSGRIEIGRVIFELISARASDYPRKPGEELELTEAGGGQEPASSGPFAKLAELKPDDQS